MRPPLLLVGFVEVNGQFFAAVAGGFEGPGAFVGADGMREVALQSSIHQQVHALMGCRVDVPR